MGTDLRRHDGFNITCRACQTIQYSRGYRLDGFIVLDDEESEEDSEEEYEEESEDEDEDEEESEDEDEDEDEDDED